MAVEVVTAAQFDARFAGLAHGLARADFRRVLPAVAQMAVSDVKKNFAEGHAPDGTPWRPLAHGRPGRPAGAKPLRDTGVLLASIAGRAVDAGVAVGSNLAYARLHQEGGTVAPKRGKFLAIPLTKEARRAGSPRRFPRKLEPRIRKGGAAGVMGEVGKDGRLAKVHYALVKSVTVPARPFLGFSAGLLGRVDRLVIDEVLRNAGAAVSI